jgi:hypothetical protein
MRPLIVALAMLCATQARAGETVMICYNYSCAAKAWVQLSEEQLGEMKQMLSRSSDAAAERSAIAEAVGWMYFYAGQQSPVWRDRGGDFDDDEVDGRMDCIDHSVNTSTWLRLFARRGWLKYHAVLAEVKRGIFAVHWAARITELGTSQQFIVDSWFYDNGHAALVFTLREWMSGARANGV